MLKSSNIVSLAILFTSVACSGENAPLVPFRVLDPATPAASATGSTDGTPGSSAHPGDPDPTDGGTTTTSTLTDGGTTTTDSGTTTTTTDSGTTVPIPDAGDLGDASITPVDSGTTPPAGAVTFRVGSAILAGNGCTASATLVADGAGFKVAFREMAINLNGAGALSDRRVCSIRVPVDIPSGYYIARINQKVDYAVDRSAGAKAALSTQATMFGLPTTPYTINHDSVLAESLAHATATSPVTYALGSAGANAMCSTTRTTGGLMSVTLAITAQRAASQSVAVSIDSFDFHDGVDVELAKCPTP